MAGELNHTIGCREFRRACRRSRRGFLTVGALAGIELSLADVFRARASAASGATNDRTFGKARRVIVLYLHGGHPQHETWDPKPNAPVEVRGEGGVIDTRIPGVQFSDLLPRSSALADKLTVIRSMSHANPNHVQACLPAMTGHKHPAAFASRGDFPPSGTDFPPFGAVLDYLRPAPGNLPTWVQVGPLMTRNNGTVLHGQLPGFLGAKHSSFAVNQDFLPADVTIKAVASTEDVSTGRLRDRQGLLDQIDAQRRVIDATRIDTLDEFYQRAFNLLGSAATRQAFDLASEPEATRAAYGQTQFGQSCLLARRLAEAGVPMTNVHFCKTPVGSWDTHSKNFDKMKTLLAPTFDAAFTTLVADLDQRGLLDEVLVVATAEFGRTPQINRSAGRDHWPWVYSIALAGAGVKPGVVYGASDSIAGHPAAHAHDPADFAATLYHLLGVPPNTTLRDQVGREHHLIIGKKIDGILA